MPAHTEGGTTLGLDNNRSAVPNHFDGEFVRMEAWLDENQEFAQNYFIRKATRNVVDSWLVAHASPAALVGTDMMLVSSPTHVNQQQCSSRSGSGATTPVR